LSVDGDHESETLVADRPDTVKFDGADGGVESPQLEVAAVSDAGAEVFPARSYATTETSVVVLHASGLTLSLRADGATLSVPFIDVTL
jgi:hypothetical protein